MCKSLILALTFILTAPATVTATPVISVGFSPSNDHSALQLILTTIHGARRSIDVAAYSFTSKPIAAALVTAKKRGVSVRVVADAKANDDMYTAVTFLANQGIPVRLDAQYAIMHNKFMVADGNTIQTGSFNYSASAVTRNAENVLRIQNAPDLAVAYTHEFNRLWNESRPVKARY